MDWADIYTRLAADTNDAQAWAALERRVGAWTRAVFWVAGSHVVEDIVADTCAAVAVGLDHARGPQTFSGFTLGHFLNVRRRARRNGLVSLPLGDLDVAAPADDRDPIDPDDEARLRAALADLPWRERRAVIMRYFEERDSASIAAELGVSTVNARRILFRGLRRMRAQLGPRRLDDAAATRLSTSAA